MYDTIAITDAQIETLRTEAGSAGDTVMVALCDRALHLAADHPDMRVRPDPRLADTEWADATVDEARREVERVIRAALLAE